MTHPHLLRFLAIGAGFACLHATARAQSANGAANSSHGTVTNNNSTDTTAAINYLLASQPGNNNGNKQPKTPPAPAKPEGQAIVDQLEATVPGLELDLNVAKNDQKGFSFSTPRSAPVVLYFWSSQDKASLAALPQIRAAANKYPTAEFIGTNFDPSAPTASKTPGGVTPPGTQRVDSRGFLGDVPRRLHVGHIPLVYVFDATGTLVGMGEPRDILVFLATATATGKKN